MNNIMGNRVSVVHEEGYCYVFDLISEVTADAPDAPTQSKLRLFEDGTPLALPHSLHADIRNNGSGRYSHWGTQPGPNGRWHTRVYFSASDSSNPLKNGRTYTFRVEGGFTDLGMFRYTAEPEINRLLVPLGGGLGNRFPPLCSAMRIANFYHRTMFVDWRLQPEVEVSFLDLFEDNLPFHLGRLPEHSQVADYYPRDATGTQLLRPPRIELTDPAIDIFVRGFDYYANHLDVRSLNYESRDPFMREIGDQYKRLPIREDIAARLHEFDGLIDFSTTLGIHIRRAPKNSIYTESDKARDHLPLETFVNAARMVVDRYPHIKSVYISTNDQEVRSYIADRFTPMAFVNERAGDGFSKLEFLKEAFVEMNVLSKCAVILRPKFTTFSYFSSIINLIPIVNIVDWNEQGIPSLEWQDWDGID